MPFNATDTERLLIELVDHIARDLHGEVEEPIERSTRLIADLGFASLDFVRLIVDIEERLQAKIGFHDLLMQNGRYVNDLTVGQFVDFICRRERPATAAPSPAKATAPGVSDRVTPQMLDVFRSLLPSPERWVAEVARAVPAGAPRNPRAAFVLSSPRAGSTLLRVLLAGNPRLFSPPELHLLNYVTMGQRRGALDNPGNRHLMTGVVHAIVNLRGCSVHEAEAAVEELEAANASTQAMYARLQGWLNGRLLVDKTPPYTYHTAILQRAEREFDEPLYIHLVRHPCGMIKSFQDAKIDQLIPFMRNSAFDRRQGAELMWLLSQANVLDFFSALPARRRMVLRYEDVVADTEGSLRGVCDFLGVPFHADMLDPYKDEKGRMVDGMGDVGEFSGDLKFHLHNRIEPDAAERWRQFGSEATLGDITREMAARLGYAMPA